MDRIRRSREEAVLLRGQPVSEVTPSRRDFAQYVAAGKEEPAFIIRLSTIGTGWNRAQLVARAMAADDADAAAISLSLFDDTAGEDLAAISSAISAPILREDPLVESNQLYHARLHGVDAVVLPAAALPRDELASLIDVAASMHMSVVVACTSPTEADAILQWPYTIVGISDLASARAIGERLPKTRTVVLLSPIATPDEYRAVRGACDAVIIGPSIFERDDLEDALQDLRDGV